MYRCRFCEFSSNSLISHLEHHKFHRHISPYIFCGFNACTKFFKHEIHLKKHLLRSHHLSLKIENPVTISTANKHGKFICTVNLCQKQCDKFSVLLKHLKSHINRKQAIICPFSKCNKKYSILSSFTGHLTKKHRKQYCKINVDSATSEDSGSKQLVPENNAEEEQLIHPLNEDVSVDAHEAEADENCLERLASIEPEPPGVPADNPDNSLHLYLHNLAQFYLKLESELLLPASTIQTIVSELAKMQQEAHSINKKKLYQKLIEENIAPERANQILDEVLSNDPIVKSNATLSSNYRRKKFYKEEFDYVNPETVSVDETKKTFFSYVPIIETLKYTFLDKSVQNELIEFPKLNEKGVLSDFMDGSAYKNNNFFQNNPNALKILMYQDSFEIVNPIGAAKKKHKILAVYMNIGNLPDYLLTHTSTIKLVALCKEVDFDHKKVYGKIVEDLKKLENGVEMFDKVVKGSLIFITGDNLGSHGLGGFIENFSLAKYFCRFCDISREEFEQENGESKYGEWRTVQSYNEALEKKGRNNDYKGIKFDSIFNELQNYHVCSSGLPPCIGHDLFEGIVAYDLYLFIDYFIHQKKWFTLTTLNRRIEKFPYSVNDRQDKPCTISDKKNRIPGGACQIWTFLRIFPLLVEDKIKDFEDEVWFIVMLLTEIVEIVCAPKINESYLPYLDNIICEYLFLRRTLFPDSKLRPKHHYARHFSTLISIFGPLIKVWTMRFESKHRYFKRSIRYLLNFINVVKSLSEKHELYQSFVRLGSDIRLECETSKLDNFDINMYSTSIISAIKIVNLPQEIQECSQIRIKGTIYNKGDALVICQDGYQNNVVIGKICTFLHCDEADIYVLFEVLDYEYLPYIRTYKIKKTISYKCCSLERIMDYKPMNIYNLGHMLCIKPRHGFVKDCF